VAELGLSIFFQASLSLQIIPRVAILKKLILPINIHNCFIQTGLPSHKVLFIFALVLILVGCTKLTATPIPPTDSSPTLTSIEPTSTAIPSKPIALPPQGLYDSCVPDDADCLDHINTLSEKGFTLILNYGQLYGTSAGQVAYADRAQAQGMKVIWCIQYRPNLPDDWMISKYTELARESQCAENSCLIQYFVNLVKDHPATWGYYVADEVAPAEYSKMKEWTDLVKKLDPQHPRLFVTAGSNDPMEQYYRFHSYMGDLVDVFGPDYYPYGYIEAGNDISRFTGAAANHAQYWADKLNKEGAIVLQAFSQIRYSTVPLCMPWPICAPFPSYEQMKAQRDQVLLNSHPSLILWWTYADILETKDPTQHLEDLAAAAFAPVPTTTPVPEISEDPCPRGWQCEDIGHPNLKGTQSQNNETWTIQGSGWDIWAELWVKADQFRYVWQSMPENFKLSARVISQTSVDFSAKSGLMIRRSFDPVSPYYAVYATPGTGIRVQYRPGYGQESKDLTFVFQKTPVYLQVVRTGTTYGAYISQDANSWELIPKSTITLDDLNGTLMAGLVVTSHNEDEINTATFDHMSVEAVAP
jgi:hypothetical protein